MMNDSNTSKDGPLRSLELDLKAFHRMSGQDVGTSPQIRSAELRARLIIEEAIETAYALVRSVSITNSDAFFVVDDICREMIEKVVTANPETLYDPVSNIAEVIDGCVDLIYVTVGTAVTIGVSLDMFWLAVHAANMQKAGGPVVNGKLMKPRNWQPPDIRTLFENLRPEMSRIAAMDEQRAAQEGA